MSTSTDTSNNIDPSTEQMGRWVSKHFLQLASVCVICGTFWANQASLKEDMALNTQIMREMRDQMTQEAKENYAMRSDLKATTDRLGRAWDAVRELRTEMGVIKADVSALSIAVRSLVPAGPVVPSRGYNPSLKNSEGN